MAKTIEDNLMELIRQWNDIYMHYSSITNLWHICESTDQSGCYLNEFTGESLSTSISKALSGKSECGECRDLFDNTTYSDLFDNGLCDSCLENEKRRARGAARGHSVD